MNNIPFNKLLIVQASLIGYKINNDGKIINPKGQIINGYAKKIRSNSETRYLTFRFLGKQLKVHHLVALQKFGVQWLFGDLIIRHKNDNSLDNSFDNIVLGTVKDNYYDQPKEKQLRGVSKAHEACRKFTDEQVRNIREAKKTKTYTELAKEYQCHFATIKSIVKRRSYKHIL